MDVEKLKQDIVTQIRSLLVSTKNQCDLSQLRKDYQTIMGCDIPLNKLGYKNLEQFLSSVPSLILTKRNGITFVDAAVSNKSAHIVDLVSKQKTNNKKKPNNYVRRPPRPPPKLASFTQPQMGTMKWKPKNLNNHFHKSYETSPRLAAVSHNQFVNYPSYESSVTPRLQKSTIKKVSPPQTPKPSNVREDEVSTPKTSMDRELSLSAKSKQRLFNKVSALNLQNNNNLDVSSDSLLNKTDMHVESTPKPKTVKFIYDLNNSSKPFELTGDHLLDLINFTSKRDLGEPIVKIVNRKTKWNGIIYDCNIKVGSHSFSSYPKDFHDENAAKQEAARQALDELVPKYGRRKSLLLSDDKDILERIPSIVRTHFAGLWSWQLEADYVEMFQEQLPINWLEVIDSLPCISVTPSGNKFIIQYCNPEEVAFQKRISTLTLLSNVSVPTNTVKFNDEGWLTAEITCAVSAGEIWCRQLNTPEAEAYLEMIQGLEEYYNKYANLERVVNVEVGGYYMASCESSWSRVRVFEINGNEIHCFCIDFGDEVIVNKDSMFRLHRHFALQQAQAFVCRLAEIEELYEASKSCEYMGTLVGRVVHVILENEDESSKTDPNDPALCVMIYNPDTGSTVNEELSSSILIEASVPVLNKEAPTEVYITHVEAEGTIFVQIRKYGYEQLCTLMDNLQKRIEDGTLPKPRYITPNDNTNQLYLMKHSEDKLYYRTKILEFSPDKRFAQMMFIDTGKTAIVTVTKTKLYPLKELNETLGRFPAQALMVRMPLQTIPNNFTTTITNLMPADQPVLVKLIEEDKAKGHVVEFFKRSEADNVLFSVNNAIVVETEFKNFGEGGDATNGMNKSKSVKLQRLISLNQFDDSTKNVPSTGSLSCPPLPEIGTYFDVKIPCAVHPHSFFVQPHQSKDKLTKMMAGLQEKYKNIEYSPLNIQDIQPGKIYASKHEDGIWYRTSVIKVIHSGSISVFYCDFGYYANLTIQQLNPLDPEFMELPFQAIKAKLADVQPVNSKWTMDDCKFFEQLVCRKTFVSILMGIEKDVLYRYDTVLNLKLIDTTTSADIYVNKLLVDNGIAIEVHGK